MSETRPVGAKVSVDNPKYPGIWIVKSVGPVNTVLTPVAGGRGLRVPHYMLTEPTEEPAVPKWPTTFYDPGALVRIPGGRYAGLWVVIADKGADKVNLAKLGGDGGRYLRATRIGLVSVPAADVVRALNLAELEG